jgi:hypothetical protein
MTVGDAFLRIAAQTGRVPSMEAGIRASDEGGILRVTLTALILTLAVAGCSADTTAPDPDSAAFTATIDGTAWRAAGTQGAIQVTRAGQFIVIAGSSTDLVAVSFTLPLVSQPGTHSLVPPGPYHGQVMTHPGGRTWLSSLAGGSGSVTVTTITESRIAGTFQFHAIAVQGTPASGTRQVTNGRFDLSF